jgi:hypothetical protein
MAKKPLKNVWEQHIAGLDLKEANIFRPIIHEDVEYLCNKYPFLQMVNIEAKFEGEITPKFITSQSGWTIHDYGDAMSASPGEFLFGGGNYKAFLKEILKGEIKEEEGGEGGAMVNPGKGTIVKQMFDTATEMVKIAIKKWPGIEIIDGTNLMKWAAWLAAKEKNYALEGFDPDEEDIKKYERVTKHELTIKQLEEKLGYS